METKRKYKLISILTFNYVRLLKALAEYFGT